MKLSKIIGSTNSNNETKLISDSQGYLSQIFTELAAGWETNIFGSKIGGDPLLLQLVAAMPHYCDLTGYNYLPIKKAYSRASKKLELNEALSDEAEKAILANREYNIKYPDIIDTAATDGNVFYWAPHYVLSKSKFGIRLLIGHEGTHAELLHPNKRGSRIPGLWNISIDFKSNYNVISDLRARKFRNPEQLFKELSDFVSLEDYASFIRDPYNPPQKMIPFSPKYSLEMMLNPNYVDLDDELPTILFAEPNLKEDMLRPEAIYNYLLEQVPKCDECGRLFCYKVPEEIKKIKKQIKEIQDHNAKKYGTEKRM